jgi:hypothetical protein
MFMVQYLLVAIVLLALLIVAALVWCLSLARRLTRIDSEISHLLGAAENPSSAQMLAECLASVRQMSGAIASLRSHQRQVESEFPGVIRHVGLVRFSPFHDTGGDQSFALALLDGRGDGVVVTALHSRTDSRLYAKPVESRASSYTLTPEEREAIERAFGSPAATASR